jgi:hypothetical protein
MATWLAAVALAAAAAQSDGLADPLAPRAAAIRDLSISSAGAQVVVSFRLEHAFGPEIDRRLESGLPTGWVYELEMLRDRKRWSDEELDSARLEVVAMFNAVTQEYLINTKQDGKLIDSRTVRERAELERAMTVFQALPVFALRGPSSRERYLVRARVELSPGSILGFIPVRRTTSWVESNKIRIKS